MRTILGFDSWTGGAHNFARLVPAFKEYGFDLQLLHIGSWGVDVGRPKEEIIENLKVRDVSHYGKKSLPEILDIVKPVAVLFLSNDVFAHRAFNRYCGLRGIPTLRLYHGLVEVQATQSERMYKINLVNQLRYVLSRIPKAITKIWPLYAHALYKSKADPRDWIRFLSDIYNLTAGKYIQVAAADSRTTACAVYTEADVSHAVTKYGHSESHVHPVGNPDLTRFNLTAEMLGYAASERNLIDDEVIYIDTGLIYIGMAFTGVDDYFSYLTKLLKILKSQGLSLAIKLHPAHSQTNLHKRIDESGIRVIENDNFVPSLLKCRAAMVEPSTAAMIPALLGLPLLMVAFDKLKNQKYGKVLLDYPRSCLLTDAEMALTSIRNIESENRHGLDTWIQKNSGPLPAEDMPRRVADVLAKLVQR